MSSDSETDQSRSENASLSKFEEEDEELEFVVREGAARSNDDDMDRPYTGEPMADANWVQQYYNRREEERQRNEILSMRLSSYLTTQSWCTCGHCHIEKLSTAKECQCCRELEAVATCFSDERVFDDVDEVPRCIIQHPGFSEVCLAKCSLRHLADKYRTKENVKYRKTGTENGFFRAVAYREFSRLVHGRLGNRRIPLPAGAYHKIRTQFPGEEFKGFDDED
ncbi:uncharacterized protein LOC135689016 [Rhopilema esculentum]|uniref:uncharacterized protein LOC135689016 n=1 Tax=Rhopilema esculentum TaxID=499914 RepID=UPI0031DB77DB|eukprot:gene7347-13079_t